jgi:hypothetical protein
VRHGEGQDARGARAKVGPSWAGLGRAGLGRTAGQNPVARTTTDQNPIPETKSETRLGVFGYTPLKFSPCPIECLNLRSGY